MEVDDSGPPQSLGQAWQPEPQTQAFQQQQYLDPNRKLLDLVFIQDCTGSQGSYIASATKNIEEIYSAIHQSERLVSQDDLRIGLIAFRDHPPQDHTYVTRNFGFSSDPKQVQEHLKSLYAAGGGDGPEAVTAALGEALEMDWRPTASKMVVLIADAPPHGIGEYGDGFSDGSPDGRDPLQIVRQMAQRGITLYATDFYQAITGITSGLMLPLTTANLLAHAIIGSVLENLDMERLIREVGQAVAQRILGGQESVDDVARELHEKLLLRNESTKKLVVENIYRESEEAKHNVQVWQNSPDLATARPQLKKVRGPRFTDKYLMAAGSRRSGYSPYGPALPSRPRASLGSAAEAISAGRPAASTTLATPPSSPPTAATSPSSRKPLTDFAAFGSPTKGGVFGTAVQGNPSAGLFGRPSPFAGIRDRSAPVGMFDEDDEDNNAGESGSQRIELRQGSISFDQAKRIALQSAWRGTMS
ncbi:hypothetical protein FRC01_000709 [Tulasnella sp. 417]|nr:hypothetical protein FRC01_000709 [Tulasnella sp. 417]